MKMLIDGVELPQRKTDGSCGYDIRCPMDLDIPSGCWMQIDTGIQMEPGDIPDGYFAMIAPRSSMGNKYKLRLANTVGIIDSDYTMDTIKAMFTVETEDRKDVSFQKNERIFQMIVVPFGLLSCDIPPERKRTGGVGSTGRY